MGTSDQGLSDAGKELAHYVLLGHSGQAISQTNLLLAQDYLVAFAPTFGFSADEAAHARRVTIIADTAAVSQEVETRLAEGGAQVQRIQGTVAEVMQALRQRIASGQPF